MQRTILAAVAVTGLVVGGLAGPVLAGAEGPPVLRLAKLMDVGATPARTAARTVARKVTPAPAPKQAAAPGPAPPPAKAPTPEAVPAIATASEPIRVSQPLRVDPDGTELSLHSEAWIDAQAEGAGGAQWECLTQALYFEARGENAEGLFAVAEVILNRVDSSRYPDTVCDVINQGTGRKYACQFTYTCDGLPEHVKEPKAWIRVGKVAEAMLDGAPRVLTDGALFYHATRVSPSWSLTKALTSTIGEHRFYR